MGSADRPTRREVARSALLGGGTVVALAFSRLGSAAAAPGDRAEMETLARLSRLEQTTAVAYRAFAEGVLLPRPVADAAAVFGHQAQQHADALARALEALGGTPPPPPSPTRIDGLAAVRGRGDFLAFAIALENRNVRAYVDALAEIESPGTLALCSAAMNCAGQHLVVLREGLGATPAEAVPQAFETGLAPAPS